MGRDGRGDRGEENRQNAPMVKEVLVGDEEETTENEEEGSKQDQEVWVQSRSTKQRHARKKFCPAMAARQSTRNRKTGAANNKNQEEAQHSPGTFQTTLNSFAILNTCDIDDLETLALDYDISLGDNREEIYETISAMKIEEIARAKLAEANFRIQTEKRILESNILEGENLELQVVDNKQRGIELKEGVGSSKSEVKSNEGQLKEGQGKQKRGGGKMSKLSRELKRISTK